MMVAVFAGMLAALVFGWLNRMCAATACILIALVFGTVLFLYEVYSPDYGFRMPWIQVEHARPLREG